MIAIITRQNEAGVFENVGSNNRMVVELKTKQGIRNRAIKFAGKDRLVRIEFFGENLYQDPIETIVI